MQQPKAQYEEAPAPPAARPWTVARLAGIFLVAVTILAAAVRLLLIDTQSVWLDEAYSLGVAHHSLGFIVTFISHYDLHPPLYYIALHLVGSVIGYGPMQARLLSVVAGVVSVLALYSLTAELFDRLTAICAALLLAVSPIAVWYSDEARMYMLAGCFVLLALASLVLAISRQRAVFWGGYAVFAALAVYTDYSALYPLAGAFIYALILAIRRQVPVRAWLASNGVAVLLALPLIPILVLQLGNLHEVAFISKPTPTSVGASLSRLVSLHAGNHVLVGIIAIALTILGLVALSRDRRDVRHGGIFVACLTLAPIIIPLAISQVHAVFLTRTIMTAAFGLVILFGAGIAMLLRRFAVLGLLAFALLLAVNAISLHAALATPINENWPGAVQAVRQQALPGDVLLFDPEYGQLPFDVYWSRVHSSNPQYGFPYTDGLLASNAPSLATPSDLQRVLGSARTIWLVDREFGSTAPPNDAAGAWLRQHYRLAATQEFYGATVFRFTTLPPLHGPNATAWREAASTVLRNMAPHDLVVVSGSGASTFTSLWDQTHHLPGQLVPAPAAYDGSVFAPTTQTRHIWLVTMPRGTADPAGLQHDWLYHHGPQVGPIRMFGPLRVYEFAYDWNRG